MRSSRAVAGVVGALALALALGGCVVFKGPVKAKQVGQKPKVAVKFTLCNSDPEPGSICPNLGNSNDGGDPSGMSSGELVLLGFRVPRGSGMPNAIHARGDVVDGALRPFRPYARELNAKAPTRRGFRWFGYSASPDGDDGGNDSLRYERATFRAVIGLPAGFSKRVFKLRPVVGWFGESVSPGFDCGPDPFEPVEVVASTGVICIDSPSRAKTRRSIRVPIG